ncbi:hypothetical protein M422DRAFT_777999 [Sphaerobolus stellatus SS14]|uniref:4-coumarate--CoA ligase n=1 Tax=Sphaerobolus stellatus (strain SS14) TaxID=990650 RepID=A0A0C9VVW0_SPHS4|nr:hypothetical protein M422DRAFT_777999 [Sphaerobolus stellatus SS14]
MQSGIHKAQDPRSGDHDVQKLYKCTTMLLFRSTAPPFVLPPDHLIIPDIILNDDFQHPTKPNGNQDLPCIIDERTGFTLTLRELRERTYRLANVLKGRWNPTPGDIITLFIPNHTDYPVCIWAGHLLGCTIAPTSPTLTVDELVYQLEIVRPTLIIAYSENVGTALKGAGSINLSADRIVTVDSMQTSNESALVPSLPDLLAKESPVLQFSGHKLGPGEAKKAIAFLCFSSGTTGKPKAVAISHYNAISNMLQAATFNRFNENYTCVEEQRFRPGDVCSGVLPSYHIYGLMMNLHIVIYAKMTLVVSQKFDFAEMLKSIGKYHITHIIIVPPQAVLFCKHPAAKEADLSSVRVCMMAGAPVTAELTEELVVRFPGAQLGQAFGMTETSPAVSMWPVTQKVGTPGSAGQLVSGTVAKVVKEDGNLAKVGESGELYIKGEQVALGYYKNEAATKEVFVDGWVRTGDIALFQANGDMFIVDRVKELIKVKGFQVAPAELEGHLLAHQDVADAAVIGIPHDYAGEVPMAFIVLKSDKAMAVHNNIIIETEARKSIFEHVSSTKSEHKWLTGGITFVDTIPKSLSGKILRRVLREQVKISQTKPKL